MTAKQWVIFNGKNGEILFGKNENKKSEIASMTKAMTCYIVVQMTKKLRINPREADFEVSKHAAST